MIVCAVSAKKLEVDVRVMSEVTTYLVVSKECLKSLTNRVQNSSLPRIYGAICVPNYEFCSQDL